MKMCGRCRQEKHETEFSPSARFRRGTWCRSCHLDYVQEWRRNEPEAYQRIYNRSNAKRLSDPRRRQAAYEANNEARKRRRDSVIAILGGACRCCKESEPRFLQVDHVKNDGPAHRRQLGATLNNRNQWAGAQYRIYKEIVSGKTDGLQLLCANCNWGKSQNRGICPHEEERVASALLCA